MQCMGSAAITSEEYADFIADYVLEEEQLAGQELDYCSLNVNEQFRINYVNRSQLPEIRIRNAYYYGIPKLYGLQQQEFNTLNLSESAIFQVQQPPLALTGKNVLIGFVDTGVRYNEDVFRDAFGNTRIEAIWDQSLEIPGRAPNGFFYGSEFLREEIDRALRTDEPREVVPSWDADGHGSRMAAIAAGSNLGENTFIGAAPYASLLVVKLKPAKQYLREYYLINEEAAAFQENDIMLACKYLLQYARVFEKPLVIVLGVGTNWGDHAGGSPLGRYLSELNRKRNVAVLAAGGNEGNANHHFYGNLSGNEADANTAQNSSENVEIRVGEGERGFVCELWGSSPDVFEIGIISPGGERIPRINFNYREGRTYTFVYEQTQIDVEIVLVEEFSSQELIFMRFREPTPGVWTIQVYNRGRLYSGGFHVWLPMWR